MYSEKIKELISKMTFQEKLGQMSQIGTSIYSDDLNVNEEVKELIRSGKVGSFLSVTGVEALNEMQRVAVEESRLKIPLFFGHDIIYGYRTIFPASAGEACSFEPELSEENYKIIAKETRANGIHVTWSPMVDITYDQRWGRGMEGAGEDVYLGKRFATARVKGFQHGDLKDNDTVAACAKHWIGYGGAIAGRDYNSVDVSDDMLYNTYLPTFKSAVDAGVEFVMTAFHDLNGIPCTTDKEMLRDVLRGELGFKGIVISDAGSLDHVTIHGVAKDNAEEAQKGLDAGLDIEMMTSHYKDDLPRTPENEKLVDEAVYRILDLKFRLGLFENPYTDVTLSEKNTFTEEHQKAALNSAKRSAVLVENNGILPMKNKKVCVIGALSDDRHTMIGGWTPAEKEKSKAGAVTVLEAVKNCKDLEFAGYAPAYDFLDDRPTQIENVKNKVWDYFWTSEKQISEAVEATKNADVILYVAGETNVMNGEAKSRIDIGYPKPQLEVLEALKKTGKPIVMLTIAGRPMLLGQASDIVDAHIFSYGLGSQMGNAIAEIITGAYNPSAKLCYTVPMTTGQCPIYYSHNNTGKPCEDHLWYTSKYIDGETRPKYPFGYGKSYTEFEYTSVKTDKESYKFGDKITVSVTVKNVGKYDGEEVIQVYMRDVSATIARPVKQLIAFKKVMIKKGEEITYKFEIDSNEMGYYHKRKYVKEAGDFLIFAGGSSATTLNTKIEIV